MEFVMTVTSRKDYLLCRRDSDELNFCCEEALPLRRWVQRRARLCTQCDGGMFGTIRLEDNRVLELFRHQFGKPPFLWPNSVAEGELPIPI
jgi:hypothetical protein